MCTGFYHALSNSKFTADYAAHLWGVLIRCNIIKFLRNVIMSSILLPTKEAKIVTLMQCTLQIGSLLIVHINSYNYTLFIPWSCTFIHIVSRNRAACNNQDVLNLPDKHTASLNPISFQQTTNLTCTSKM